MSTVVPFNPRIDMPFADLSKEPFDWWVVEPSGNWSADNDTGREYAKALMRYSRAHQTPFILGYVMKEIARKGSITGIEVGFFNAIGEAML